MAQFTGEQGGFLTWSQTQDRVLNQDVNPTPAWLTVVHRALHPTGNAEEWCKLELSTVKDLTKPWLRNTTVA